MFLNHLAHVTSASRPIQGRVPNEGTTSSERLLRVLRAAVVQVRGDTTNPRTAADLDEIVSLIDQVQSERKATDLATRLTDEALLRSMAGL